MFNKQLLIALLLLVSYIQASTLCSDICAPNSCSGQSETQCTGCSSNWVSGSGTCTLDAASGYNLVAKSNDMLNPTSNVQMLPVSSLTSCASYNYYGDYGCSTTLQISLSSGISTPHYEIQVIVWVLLLDNTKWTASNNISMALGATTVTRSMGSFDGQSGACGSEQQTYYRLVADFAHVNSTNSSVLISISNDVSIGGCFWGFKQAVVLAKVCDSTCTECSGSSSAACFSCTNSNYLSGNTCSGSCLSGYGQVTGSNVCVACDGKCISCSQNSTYCSSCQTSGGNEAFLFGSACVNPCPNTTFAISSNHTCGSCSSNCLICTDSTTCTLCQNGYFLYNQTCVSSCPAGTYADNSSHCLNCDPKCLACAVSSTNCSSCTLSGGNQAFLFNSTCLSGCPTGYYSTSSPNLCNSCNVKCSACDTSSTNCSACTLSGANTAYLFNMTCISSCPNGTYATANPNVCNSCDLKCISCGVSSTNCSSCTLSGSNKAFLYNSSCLSSCPGGYYSSSSPNLCNPCNVKCSACDTSSTNCSACTLSGANTAYLFNMTCISSCPNGTYTSTNPNVCNSCDTKCSVCSGPSNSECSSCSSGNVLSNTTCDSSCLAQYGPASASTCIYCSLYCVNCYAVTNNCSSCTTSGTYEAFLDSTASNYTKCVTACNATGKFANTVNHKCDSCNANCLTCLDTATKCLSCNTGDGWLNFTCYSTCPDGYYKNGNNCTICDSLCSKCNVSATNCSVCSASAYLLNFTCYTLCPNPYYNDNNGGPGPNLCLPCHTSCAICTGGTNTSCSSCTTNYTLSATTCDSSCLTGYGVSPTTGVCVLCDGTDCTGCYMISTNCTSCSASPTQYYLLTISGSTSCVNSCPIGYYLNSTILSCLQCPLGCYDCSNDTNCYSCNATYLFFNNSCYSPCPNGTFQQTATNCTACNNECKTCTGPADNCTSCQTNGTYRSFLLGTVCFTTCPGSTYGYTGDYTCRNCHAVCMTCAGGGTSNCYICNYPYILSGNTCATNCTAGYGVTTTGTTCVKCNNTCTQCAYISTNCTACQSSGNYTAYLYYDNVTYPQCLMVCPNGTTGINSTRTCSACATGCQSCHNTTTNCSACLTDYGLLNSTCYDPCPSAYFLSGTTCAKCSPYCLSCNNTNTSCSSCVINGTYKSYFFNNTCVTTCPNGYFKFDNSSHGPTVCNPCNSSCSKCTGNENNCTSCKAGFYLYNRTCLSTCPSGYFGYNATRTCNDSSVDLTLSIGFTDSLSQTLVIDLDFTDDLNQATFPRATYQNITFSDSSLSLSLFTVSYSWTNTHAYRISLTPKSYIFIYNVTVTVTSMFQPSPIHYSSTGAPFASDCYNQSVSTNWFLIKGSGWSSLESSIMNTFSAASDSLQSFTTLVGVQQLNKAGFMSLIFPGAQLTSSSVLINSVPPQNCYEGARFWSSFIFFQTPKWQKNKQQQKYVIQKSTDNLVQNSRLLSQQRKMFELNSLYWRFNRTGFTTFFLFDCYMQMLLIAVSWVLLFIARKLQSKVKQSVLSRFYSVFHGLHQITIFYLSLGLVLELLYFDLSSTTRVISLIVCLLFNAYYIVYTLYVYYQVMKYPLIQIGSSEYRQMAKKYGYFLKRIRFQEYDDLDKWSPKHIFRPYNYHIVSFYKKYLMIISVALFYEFPEYAAGTLLLLQAFQITRFIVSWPFASKARNLIRLALEIVLMVFFLSLFLQVYFMSIIAENNLNTIVHATDSYYTVGWIGFICIFIFNLSFFVIVIHNVCCFLTKSNSEQIRQIRRNYYYEKVLKFQNCNEITADNEVLDSWVIKGDLNQNWVEDKQVLSPDIDITVEKYIINKMGEGFAVQMEKITSLEMKHINSTVFKQKLKVREQVCGTIGLTKHISPIFLKIVSDVFEQYDPTFQADFLTIKTVAKIQTKKYRSGDLINLSDETHIQSLTLQYPGKDKKTHKLAVPLRGFPLNPEILNPLIFDKTLNKKYLY